MWCCCRHRRHTHILLLHKNECSFVLTLCSAVRKEVTRWTPVLGKIVQYFRNSLVLSFILTHWLSLPMRIRPHCDFAFLLVWRYSGSQGTRQSHTPLIEILFFLCLLSFATLYSQGLRHSSLTHIQKWRCEAFVSVFFVSGIAFFPFFPDSLFRPTACFDLYARELSQCFNVMVIASCSSDERTRRKRGEGEREVACGSRTRIFVCHDEKFCYEISRNVCLFSFTLWRIFSLHSRICVSHASSCDEMRGIEQQAAGSGSCFWQLFERNSVLCIACWTGRTDATQHMHNSSPKNGLQAASAVTIFPYFTR